ncbi:MAG: HlyD family secretion protein [Rhodobacterales bacterium]|nr:HlyD family secretion protein [Rhodobacterales bacterium]
MILALALLIIGWHAIADKFAPSTQRGTITAQVIQIAPRVSGRVTEVLVQDNQIVQAGTPLFRVDPRPYELAVASAREKLRDAALGVDASTAQIEAAQAQVAQARANVDRLRADAERLQRLADRGSVSRVQAEQAASQLKAAEAALDTAMAQAEAAQRQLGEVDSNPKLETARLALEQAEYDLISTTILAPAVGAVSNMKLAVGQFVSVGTPTLTFLDGEDIWITAELRENQLRMIKPGSSARLLFDAAPGHIFEGKVNSIGWGIAAGPNQSGGLPVNAAPTQWFEPARRMPVRIDFDALGIAADYPIRFGGQVDVVVIPESSPGVVTGIAGALQRLRSWISYLY